MLGVSNSRPIQTHNRQIAHRLFCFTYAGGAASIYRNWSNQLPQSIEAHAVQFPGHGNRLSEPLFRRVQPLVESTAQELMPYLEGTFAFFGHSMGAIISFELNDNPAAVWARTHTFDRLLLMPSSEAPPSTMTAR
jgi:surfactin synthase thioesterase subunit